MSIPLRSFAVLLSTALAVAQQAEPAAGLVALHQALLDAATDVVVLNVAAHPDDESSRTNTILRRRHGMRIVTVYTTYGDGGQNAIGREIGPELAGLRVRETLRAAAMSGVDVRWLGMPDFGFSKTLDETLSVWGADRLRDAMREVIDRVDPDVVLTNHSLTQGHGHHRASFWAVTEVLKERAAAGRFAPPMYARCALEQAQLTFDPAELDPARGETFARLAHRAWTQHVTQGPWGPHNPLQVGKDYWKVVLPEGLPTATAADLMAWGREASPGAGLPEHGLQMPPARLQQIARDRLLALRAELDTVTQKLGAPGAIRRAKMLRRRCEAVERVLLALANVRVEIWLDKEEVAQGGGGRANVVVHGHEHVQKLAVRCGGEPAEPVQVAVRATPFDGMPAPPAGNAPPATAPVAEEPPLPPSLEPSPPAAATAPGVTTPGRYLVRFTHPEEADSELPTTPEPGMVEVEIAFELDGVSFLLLPQLHYTTVRPIDLHWDREVLMVPRGRTVEQVLSANVKSHRQRDSFASLRLSIGPGITATTVPGRLTLTQEHDEARVLVRARIEADELLADAGIELGFRDEASRLPIRVVDVVVPPELRIGLVRGPDDTTERALADLQVPFTALDRDALLTANLEDFTAVLLDIRAYHHRPELAEVHERLLTYCRGGGRVVAMYHKPGEWNERAGHPLLAPFPMTIGDERVTEENSAVTLVQPEHRLLTHPHALSAQDFAGWVQERGLNFPKTWDPAWTSLLAMQDSGDEKPHQGSLLYTQYGRGDFVYCSLALYRQLRVGHAGAARLLVNLLAR
jgi:LmbE family N-acetylglucosaminyl deacetylase